MTPDPDLDTEPPPELPSLPPLDRPLGSVDHRLRRTGPDRPVIVRGRRAMVRVGDGGVRTLWLPTPTATGLGVRAAGRELLETPLGVERTVVVGGSEVIERTVVSRDAPVIWLEWVAAGAPVRLDLSWRVGIRSQGPGLPASAAAVDPDRVTGVAWRQAGRGLLVAGRDGRRTAYVAGPVVDGWDVEPVDGGLEVRARAGVTEHGFRLAVASAGPGDDLERLLRIAGRTGVAVRAREGAVSRVLASGLAVSAPDPELGRAVEWARTRLDTAPGPVWRLEEAVPGALALLAAGERDPVRSMLHRLADGSGGRGRVPGGMVGADPVFREDGRAELLFLLLAARYLAWSGDRQGVRGIWDVIAQAAGTALAAPEADEALLRTVAAELAVAVEEVGEGELAARLAAAAGPRPTEAPLASVPPYPDPGDPLGMAASAGAEEPHLDEGTGFAAEGGVIRTVVEQLLGARPDAPRGRLVLQPRPGDRHRFEVRGLVVGDTAVTVAYRRDGRVHRLTVRQERGGAPLQLVLEPELRGQKIAASRVDGEEADLDARRTDHGWRVPVQMVLDQPRTLEVEFAGGSA